MKFELAPHEGTGGVRFGMTRDQVRSVCGTPSRSFPTKDFFFDGSLHVHYDASGAAEYLVVAGGTGAQGIFKGTDLLGVDAETALAIVGREAKVDEQHAEYPMTCIFPELDLDLWRSCLPEDSGGEEGRRFEAVAIARAGFHRFTN